MTDEESSWVRVAFKVIVLEICFVLIFHLAYRFYRVQVALKLPNNYPYIPLVVAQVSDRGLPVRLKIPQINVDAAISPVGVTAGGEMEVPSNSFEAGWFNLGPRPGERGSAVISGHFDGVYGEPGVFADLYKLKIGDELEITDEMGRSTAFLVSETRIYDPGYAEEVFSSVDIPRLNLITCDGVWDGTKKSFNKRLVVFADIKN